MGWVGLLWPAKSRSCFLSAQHWTRPCWMTPVPRHIRCFFPLYYCTLHERIWGQSVQFRCFYPFSTRLNHRANDQSPSVLHQLQPRRRHWWHSNIYSSKGWKTNLVCIASLRVMIRVWVESALAMNDSNPAKVAQWCPSLVCGASILQKSKKKTILVGWALVCMQLHIYLWSLGRRLL